MFGQFLVIILVGLMVFWWIQQGVFSSLLNLLSIIIAGTLALALWEPITHRFLLTRMPDFAWGVGLLGPFAIMLIGIRVGMDILVPGNVKYPSAVNVVGGGVFGFISGVLVIGLLAIGLQFTGPLAVPGYAGWGLDENGKVTRKEKLWLPVDTMAAGFFTGLSRGAMAPMTGRCLADVHPDLAREASLFHLAPDPESHRTLLPGAVDVPDGQLYRLTEPPAPLAEKIPDATGNHTVIARTVIDLEYNDIPAYSLADGRKFYIAATQVALAYTLEGQTEITFPVGYMEAGEYKTDLIGDTRRSLATRRGWRDQDNDPDIPDPRRWEGPGRLAYRQAITEETESISFKWFFQVPAGAELKFLRIKQARIPLDEIQPAADASPILADLQMINAEPVDGAVMTTPGADGASGESPTSVRPSGTMHGARAEFAAFSNNLPVAVPDRSVTVMEMQGDQIKSGKTSIVIPDEPPSSPITKIWAPDGHTIFQINLSSDEGESMWGRAMKFATMSAAPPLLKLDDGTDLGAFGYTITGDDRMEINFLTEGLTIQSLGQVGFGKLREDQTMRIYFRVPSGKTVEGWRLGAKMDPQSIGLTAP